ncbi:MAG: hypothetical protein MI864_12335 [Pseudomonadales bacterium]|nr:hypothetical protein [Pseudomonadales bacterium]
MRSNYWIVIGIFLALVAVFIVSFVAKQDDIKMAADIAAVIMMVIQIFALLIITAQLKQNKDLNKAQYLSKAMDQLADLRSVPDRLQNSANPDLNNSEIVAFLNVYELISALIDTNVISFDDIDNPFAHRFFLVTHHPKVQELELFRDAKFYKAVFKLHKNWLEYRSKKKIPTPSENSLEKYPLYQELSA